MNKLTKRTMTFVLAAIMSLTTLAGCGGDSKTTTTTPSTTSSSSKVPSSEPETPAFDLAGRVIKMQAYAADQIPSETTKTGERWWNKVHELEEKYNFTFETVLTQDAEASEDLRSSVMAGSPTYEIAVIRGDNMFKLARDGVIEPLNKMGYNFGDAQWDQFTATTAVYNGDVYAMNVGKLQPRGVIFFNKRLFKEAGLADPIDQTLKSEWTWETFLDAAKKLTKDTDGDGVIDQYGVAGPSDAVANNLIYSNEGKIVEGTDASAKVVADQPQAMKALEFFSQLVNTDKVLMPKNARQSEDWDWFNTEFKTAKTAMLIYSYWPARDFAENMADDWAFTLMPKGPDAKEYHSVSDFFTCQVMPKNIKDGDKIATIWNEINSVFADEGDDWKSVYYEQTVDERCVDNVIQMIYDGANIYEPYSLFSMATDCWDSLTEEIWTNAKTVEAAVQTYMPAMQGKIPEFFATVD